MSLEKSHMREPLAIVGLSCLFPDAGNLSEYWANIKSGRDSIGDIPLSHWQPEDYFDADPKRPDHTYAKRGGFLRPYRFNPMRYGITPQSLEATDSTQLLGMVVAEQALRHAGYAPESDFDRERTSCILGVTGTLELVIPLGARLSHPQWRKALKRAGLPDEEVEAIVSDIADSFVGWQENSFPGLLGNVVAGRIANRLNLGGTNAVVDAACASSLAALSTAIMELQTGRADMVVTGGMDTFNDIFMYMCFSKTPALSPSGEAKPFDADGDGTILGEGLGAVVIKRLSDAKRDGDCIYAVIKGMGSASDGRGKAIYAPSSKGQMKALRRAYEEAAFSPATVELVECHGTGTKVGDGVEIEALAEVFKAAQLELPSKIKTAIGSVKSQIGHTKAAAGVAGLIKAVMALYFKVLPPTIKISKPHPKLLDSPFVVYDRARPWVAAEHPRRAAVSAFGFGGSNFHCVLEEYQAEKNEIDYSDENLVIPLQATDPASLQESLAEMRGRLQNSTNKNEWELSKQLANEHCAAIQGTKACRLVLHLRRGEKLLDKVELALSQLGKQQTAWVHPTGVFYGNGAKPGKLAFIFSGQGSQYINMLRTLAIQFPQMTTALTTADIVWAKAHPEQVDRLSDLIYPARSFGEELAQEDRLRNTAVAQPAIGAVSAALYQIMEQFGLQPDLVAGHSYGELTALYAANVMSLEGFLQVSCARGRLMNMASDQLGGMLALKASFDETAAFLDRHALDLVIANQNAPKQMVLAGSDDEIKRAAELAGQDGIRATPLNVAAAFHSPIVAPAVAPFLKNLQEVDFQAPKIPVYAGSSAEPYPKDHEAMQEILATQLAKPVRFVDLLQNLYSSGARTFVEIGPQRILASLMSSTFAKQKDAVQVMAVDQASEGTSGFFSVLARLFAAGYPVNWSLINVPIYEGESSDESSFHVEISGANYRLPQAEREARAVKTKKTKRPKLEPSVQGKENLMDASHKDEPKKQGQETTPTEERRELPAWEKHLLAMQEMQARNAELHQKYLESQAHAQKMIADLLGDYRAMLSGGQLTTPPKAPSQATFEAPQPVLEPKVEPSPAIDKMPSSVATTEIPQPVAAESNRVMSLIAEKTGYPQDMLAPDMELESDLGIDSIKRVEIFSALQEEYPKLQGLPADQLAQMVKISDIMALLQVDEQQASTARSQTKAVTISDAKEALSAGQLMAIIAEKTGYPAEMLSLDMDLESDLGIDSIKRVEIFSDIQSLSAEAAQLSADDLNQVRQISDLLALVNQKQVSESSISVAETEATWDQAEQAVTLAGNQLNQLQQIIAEKTGYPATMLEAEMNLESDLGIDSIKRVEILSAMGEQFPEINELDQQSLHDVQTIGDLLALLDPSSETSTQQSDEAALGFAEDFNEQQLSEQRLQEDVAVHPEMAVISEQIRLERQLLQFEEFTELEAGLVQLPPDAKVWVTDDGSNLARNIVLKLRERGHKPRLVSVSFVDRMKAPESLDSLIVLAPQKIEGSIPRYLTNVFKLVKMVAKALRAKREAGSGQAILTIVTRSGGHFGIRGLEQAHFAYGASLAGMAKTLRYEWPEVLVTAVDMAKDFADGFEAANRLLDACRQSRDPELGVFSRHFARPVLREVQLEEGQDFQLSADDTVVLTGGARGVTFAMAHRLAHDFKCRLVIWGRSEPKGEPDFLIAAQDESAMIKALNEHGTAQAQLSLKEQKAWTQSILAAREVKANLQKLRDLGSDVIYQSVDVRSDSQIQTALDQLEQSKIKPVGFVHGAGVLADRLLQDLDEKDFLAVVETKVRLLSHLSRDLWQGLRFCVFFSSSTGRFGRQGQVAYAVANEALNKYAQYMQTQLPRCHSLAINWGPWDGGMVDKNLKKLFAAEGLAMIPLTLGVDYLLRELGQETKAATEIVCLAREQDLDSDLPLDQVIETNQASFPVLKSHIIKGQIVFPVVLHLELMVAKAKGQWSDLHFQGFGNFRVLRGIKFGLDESYQIRVQLGEATSINGGVRVLASIEGFDPMRQEWYISSTAEVWFVDEEIVLTKPSLELSGDLQPMEREEIYRNFLFHGPHLQGIEDCLVLSTLGAEALVKLAPPPRYWLNDEILPDWSLDPLALDSAFQLGVVWSSIAKSMRSLPTGIHSYVQYQRRFPQTSCRVRMVVQEVSSHEFQAALEFIDQEGHLIASMKGYRGIMDQSLADAFKVKAQLESSTRV